jgi:predicted Zn finger-like uncharacterized protein
MTITCENCQTRFVLDEARIPAQGARVRCSRCQHRFQVKPPTAQASPEEVVERAVENSAPFDPSGGREAPEEAAHAPGEGEVPDGALDNPEFLFDERAGAAPVQPPPPEELFEPGSDEPEPLAAARQEAYEPPPELPHEAREVPPAPAPPGPVFAERALAAEDPDPPTMSGSRAELFGAAPDEGLSVTDDAQAPEPGAATRSAAGIRGATGATPPGEGFVLDVAPEPVSAAPQPWRGFAREVVPSEEQAQKAPRKRAAPEVAPRALPGLLAAIAAHLAAWAVSLALVTGAVRMLALEWLQPRPAIVRLEGWLATDLDAFHARAADGRRVLVIRGALVGEGSQAPPDLRAHLLDAQGVPIGSPASALPVRLDGAALSPRALGARLDEGPARAPAGPVAGFTILVPDPSASARRYRLELARR